MKIYFACSITGGRDDEQIYGQLVDAMLAAGHDVPTSINASAETLHMETDHSPKTVYSRDIAWLEGSDVLVAELSTPSHGVGYEIAYALDRNMPVLCLHHQDIKVSKMITGNKQEGLTVLAYSDSQDALQKLDSFLSNQSPS